MVAITSNFGTGGTGLAPNQGSNAQPSYAEALRDIVLDLTDMQQPALAAAAPGAAIGAALGAFTDPPSAGEMAALRTRVNDMATRINELITLTTEMRTDMIAMSNVELRSTAP